MTEAVIKAITKDIKLVQNFSLPREEFSEYWLAFSDEVPENLRSFVSRKIYDEFHVRVLWSSGTEINIKLYD